jgi:predicted AlkP superfamily phosphohydrolase/phosphomutase
MFRKLFGLLALAMLWGTGVYAESPRVVVIGFDGADARLVEEYMAAGELPNLAKLQQEGTYRPLLPTNPPQTPVSWSSFATGIDPGRTEIFDFLKRDPQTYLPSIGLIQEGKTTFLWGTKNGQILGLAAATGVFVLAFAVLFFVSKKWPLRLAVPLVLAVAVGWGAVYLATYLPAEVPSATNNRQGTTFWELATEAGKKVRIIRVPATFPAENVGPGQMLSGLGVPDIRGRFGTPSFYTSDVDFTPEVGNDFSLELVALEARRGRIETTVFGPRNYPFYKYVVDRAPAEAATGSAAAAKEAKRIELDAAGVAEKINLPLTLEATDTTLSYEVSGHTGTLTLGEWSDWVILDFPINAVVDALQPLRGMVRFKLLQLEPELELYMSPIHFHPDCHPVAFSYPPDYSEELLDRFGLFKTMGWALDTWSLPSGVGDEELFLEDMTFTVDQYEEMMAGLVADGDLDLFVQIFYFTDRIGHMLWNYLDPAHPFYDAQKAPVYQQAMLQAYKRMDRIVGRARELVGPETLFLVCSDHGFSSYRRGVNYNNWLQEQGLLTLTGQTTERATLERLFESRDLMGGYDWKNTKAYAMGLGGIYINVIGREGQGSVLPGPEYEAVRQQIIDGLEALVDENGAKPVTKVWKREEIYSDYRGDLIPDLRVGNSLGYRVSWQTTLGGFGQSVIEDNDRAWTGDHCSNDPAVVPGILFSNRPIHTDSPRMIDMMPTIVKALGLEVPEGLDGEPLF